MQQLFGASQREKKQAIKGDNLSGSEGTTQTTPKVRLNQAITTECTAVAEQSKEARSANEDKNSRKEQITARWQAGG